MYHCVAAVFVLLAEEHLPLTYFTETFGRLDMEIKKKKVFQEKVYKLHAKSVYYFNQATTQPGKMQMTVLGEATRTDKQHEGRQGP